LGSGQLWFAFFNRLRAEFERFVEKFKFDSMTIRKFIRQLHSRFAEKLLFPAFIETNQKLNDMAGKDLAITRKYDDIMQKFMLDSYSKPLQRIFNTPGCFQSALEILKVGTSIGTPLERLTKLGDCVNVLQDIYLFEANEGCPGDDFLPLFLFALLSAKLSTLWSLAAYIRTYIMDMEEQVKMLDSREKYVATSFISAVDHIAGQCK
jgi:hypothetical protein